MLLNDDEERYTVVQGLEFGYQVYDRLFDQRVGSQTMSWEAVKTHVDQLNKAWEAQEPEFDKVELSKAELTAVFADKFFLASKKQQTMELERMLQLEAEGV